MILLQERLNLAYNILLSWRMINLLRKQVKEYIDVADDVTVKMVHAMLQVQQQNDWCDAVAGRCAGRNRCSVEMKSNEWQWYCS